MFWRGHPGLNRGPLDLQSNALPLSYTPTTSIDFITAHQHGGPFCAVKLSLKVAATCLIFLWPVYLCDFCEWNDQQTAHNQKLQDIWYRSWLTSSSIRLNRFETVGRFVAKIICVQTVFSEFSTAQWWRLVNHCSAFMRSLRWPVLRQDCQLPHGVLLIYSFL